MFPIYSSSNNFLLGYLLKKIIQDTEAKINNSLIPAERKMFLYAGHENNIASILEILGVWDSDRVTPYCSYVLLELHNVNESYGIKVSRNKAKYFSEESKQKCWRYT